MRFLILGSGVLLGTAMQATWFAKMNLPGLVKPDLILIMVICYGLLRGPDEGTLFGLVSGFFLDLLSGNVIGIGALTKMVAGFSTGLLERIIFKDNFLIPAIAVFIGTVVFESFNILMHLSFNTNINFGLTFLSSVLPLAAYNTVLSPFVYHFLIKMERYIAERNNSF